jgi:type VI protein secretion system component Hcp
MPKSFILIAAVAIIAIVAGQADAKGKKGETSASAHDLNFTHYVDKSSPGLILMQRSTSKPKSGSMGSTSTKSGR